MKFVMRTFASISMLFGGALLAWVLYDATEVMKFLGLQVRMDEAGVALLGLCTGVFLIAAGLYARRRMREVPAAS